ncbi:MAG: YlxR family protein [Clostridia bacterium]|nr:YlxR family protein [Clostridia bacterium]
MPVERKIPLRKCVGCGERKTKKELVRVVRENENTFSIDRTGKKDGRGAYLCPDIACLQIAQKKHLLERSFSCQIPDEIYARLEEELQQDG